MSKKIAVSLIGVGPGALPHGKSLLDLEAEGRVEIRAVVGRGAEKTKAFAASFPTLPVGTDLDAAIADPATEAVMLVTPPNSHLEIARRCFSAGKHVLLDKPIDITLGRSEALVAAGRAAGRKLGINLQFRFRAASLRLDELIRTEALGRIEAASMTVPWWRPQAYYDEPGRGTLARDGGGVLLTQAIHNLDLFRSLVDVAEVVAAQATTTGIHRMETEDYVAALLKLRNGAPASIMTTTAFYPGLTERIEIMATKASAVLAGGNLDIRYLDGRHEHVEADGNTGAGANIMDFPHDWHKAVLTDFLDAIRDDREPKITGEDALETHRLIDRILRKGGLNPPE